jgi:hypothetical protein
VRAFSPETANGLTPPDVGGVRDVAEESIERNLPEDIDIFTACSLAKLERVEALLQRDPELIGARGPEGATPLHFAVGDRVEVLAREQGIEPTAIAALLIERGADINAIDLCHGASVLRWSGTDRPMGRFILKHGPVLDVFEAAEVGDLRRMSELLDANPALAHARTSSRDLMGGANTPLHRACWQDQAGAAHLLLDRGADIEAVDGDHGATPLIYCAWRANFETARLLLDRGANLEGTNKYGETALKIAQMGAANGLKAHGWARPADKYPSLLQLLEVRARKPN